MTSSRIHFALMVVLGLVTAVSYLFWYTEVSKKSAAVVDLETKIGAATETMNRVTTSQTLLSQITDDEAKIKGYFVTEADVVSFINDLESRGRAVQATVSVLSVSKAVSAGRPALQLALTIKGTFPAVMRAMGAIEYAPYALTVTSASLAKDAKDSWGGNMSIAIILAPEEKKTTP